MEGVTSPGRPKEGGQGSQHLVGGISPLGTSCLLQSGPTWPIFKWLSYLSTQKMCPLPGTSQAPGLPEPSLCLALSLAQAALSNSWLSLSFSFLTQH